MTTKLKSEKMLETMQAEWAKIKGIRDTVVEEDRSYTEDEKSTIEKALADVRVIELEREKELADENLSKSIDELDAFFVSGAKGSSHRILPSGKKDRSSESIGLRFVENEDYKRWFKELAPDGRIPESKRGISSPSIRMGDAFSKTLITGASETSAGALVSPDDTGIYESLGRFPLSLRNLISVRTTTSDTVEYVRQVTQVTEAETVPEANITTYTGATGQVSGEKPEGGMTFVRVQEAVKNIAVWVAATKRALSDAGQLRGIIDQDLRDDLSEEFENQLLNGDGTGENFTGLNNASGTLGQSYVTDIAVTARKAITNLLINGRQIPTSFLFNPEDWEAYDLLKDDQGRYYWGGPVAQGPRTLWGVGVAQSFLQTAGIGWVANWRKMVVWDKEQSTISVTDSHEDFFIRNLVAILAEMRAAMGLIRPSAFCEIDLTEGS